MFQRGSMLFHMRGVPILAHRTLLLILAYLAVAVAAGTGGAVLLGLIGLGWKSLMLVLIAILVYTGAQDSLAHERLRDASEGLRLAALLPPVQRPLATVASRELLAEVLPRMRELARPELVVIDPRGAPIAVLRAEDLGSVATSARWSVTVGELASELRTRHLAVPRSASAAEAIERASEVGADYVIVVEPGARTPGHPVALLTAEDLARMVQRQLLDGSSGRRPDPSASLAS